MPVFDSYPIAVANTWQKRPKGDRIIFAVSEGSAPGCLASGSWEEPRGGGVCDLRGFSTSW